MPMLYARENLSQVHFMMDGTILGFFSLQTLILTEPIQNHPSALMDNVDGQ
jgi:hypothetical protein